MPLLGHLTKEAIMKSKNYWKIIFQEINIGMIPQNTATLENLTSAGMIEHIEVIEM